MRVCVRRVPEAPGFSGFAVGADVIGLFFRVAGDFLTECGIYGHRGFAVFAFDE